MRLVVRRQPGSVTLVKSERTWGNCGQSKEKRGCGALGKFKRTWWNCGQNQIVKHRESLCERGGTAGKIRRKSGCGELGKSD